MSVKTFLFLALLILAQPVAAQKCTIEFKIKNAGFHVEGAMEAGEIEFKFNPDSLATSTIIASAKPTTINTGIALRDKHLKKPDYFDVEKYPLISMRSVRFESTGKNKFTGYFDLTIKDVTKQVKLPFIKTVENEAIIYRGDFTINRLDFGVGEKSIVLDEKVTVSVLISLKKD